MEIGILTNKDFISFNTWISGKSIRNVELVFTAMYDTPVGAKDLYVKYYPKDTKGILNEITGWLINKSLKVPQPTYAYVVELSPKNLDITNAPREHKNTIQNLYHENSIICFATSAIFGDPAGIQLLEEYSNTTTIYLSDIIRNDVKRWESLYDAIVSDEKMVNTDRHINNLIRISAGNYAAIDNGRLFCYNNCWEIDDLTNPLKIEKTYYLL